MIHINSFDYALKCDQEDPLKDCKNLFIKPNNIYFCGNSLGLQPKKTKSEIEKILNTWGYMGVDGHFHSSSDWVNLFKKAVPALSRLCGAKPLEVYPMNSLTVNIHLLLLAFYKPQPGRYKIIIEKGAFSSDIYALDSQIAFHGLNTEDALIELAPREGEFTLRTEDIIQSIEENRQNLALVFLSGVQYYTGQYFNLRSISKSCHRAGALFGLDLAHAIGNVPLQLHDWNIDFATWCTYKYLNAGPGAISGIYVHEKHFDNSSLRRLNGWWGHDEQRRFLMERKFISEPGAPGWQMSNPDILSLTAHISALEIFHDLKLDQIFEKSKKLTSFLEFLLYDLPNVTIITPPNPAERGAQLSLFFEKNGKKIFDAISEEGVICDWREPNVIRVAPVPLYNTFEEVFRFYTILKKIMESMVDSTV
ncbi:MAG: kynureninase [Cyclobacteriaceae bacterium]|nr:kynureninase [Cyclobacteriaceae bacterium]